jgi:predicted KAP-like P-loop ATPase
MTLSNDAPIIAPRDDLYRLDPFAKAIAKSVEGMAAPDGLVLAINGPWGSGKSSAINLMRHHLSGPISRDEIVPVVFNPWWFAGADALTLAFFQELNTAIGQSLPEQVRQSFSKIGGGVSALGPIIGAAANLKAPGVGAVISGATQWLGGLLQSKQTVEQEHRIVSKALSDQKKRFLVIIDDIDRLNPEDALTIFRLVKSVGRLPNVIYLLAFDRALAERAVAERFPSEGPSYLEKIVQSAFDVPPPLLDLLRQRVLATVSAVMGEPHEQKLTRFMNVFFDVVAPLIRTPRDVVRLENDIRATWPAVAGEVDRADFLALSALKLASPEIYQAIRSHPDELCDAARDPSRSTTGLAEQYDRLFGLDPSRENYRQTRRAMMRLFPRLESIWSNTIHGANGEADRLICSRKHFPTYFAYSISDDVLPAQQIDELLQRADDRPFVQTYLRQRLTHLRRDGSTQAALALEELTTRAADVDEAKVEPLVTAIFAIVDELDVEADRKRGFAIGSNELRVHWLVNRLVTDRFPEARRDEIYRSGMATASVAWCCDFARRCMRVYEPEEGGKRESDAIVSQSVARGFRDLALDKLRAAASDHSLVKNGSLPSLLFQWKNWTTVAEVRAWTDSELERDDFAIAMADAVTSVAWVQGMGFGDLGDRVARPSRRVDVKPYSEILDVKRLDARIQEIDQHNDLTAEQRALIDAYRTSPRGSHGRFSDDGSDDGDDD